VTPTTSVADTVSHAAATPDKEQPHAALGLTEDEYLTIKEILGRRPTTGELAMYSVMRPSVRWRFRVQHQARVVASDAIGST